MTTLTFAAIVPTFNRAHSIAETLDSILSQSRPPEEVVVVDDGSTDDTARVLATFGDRIAVIRQKNSGVAAARNAGAASTNCDWLTFCDSDDIWLPARMELLRADLAKADNAIIAHVGDVQFSGHGPTRRWFEFLDTDVGAGVVRAEPHPLRIFLHSFSPIAAALRKDVFDKEGGFDVAFRTDEDSELCHRFADRGSFMIRGDVMAEARRQPEDDIALSKWRGKDPEHAIKLKEEQFRRILARARHPGDIKAAGAALSSCLRQQAELVRKGRMEGSRNNLLLGSAKAHPNPIKGVALAFKAMIGASSNGPVLDRT